MLIYYAMLVLAVSCVTFVAYGIDKRRARSGEQRIPEATLQLLALSGGWPGAWAGQQFFRHKTQKLSFLIIFWLIVALHAIFITGMCYLWLFAGFHFSH
ncbi:DUF1294 domain-containing protein [Blastopirellula sp. J2-11]|uniref:DUF1294 domain-containing protein n=1 Tax=Blastopirellula sp. J2-11 TaxID=2943192 RepID=UPI0021C9BB36|nr:DUF1294 domain-containing protein [Blastopirellula sp. J2-11]UUO04386.1 DUF1294 domain-containing protein [Blastopirellula sp. J2-11]